MTTLLVAILWLACAAFNVWGVCRIFPSSPVTLFDMFMCTVLTPIMLFIVLIGFANEVVLIKPRRY